MDKAAFNIARGKLWAAVLRLSQRGEEPEDAAKIRSAMTEMRSLAKADPYWSKEVEKLALDVDSFPLFSSDPRQRSRKHGYDSVITKLEGWAASFSD